MVLNLVHQPRCLTPEGRGCTVHCLSTIGLTIIFNTIPTVADKAPVWGDALGGDSPLPPATRFKKAIKYIWHSTIVVTICECTVQCCVITIRSWCVIIILEIFSSPPTKPLYPLNHNCPAISLWSGLFYFPSLQNRLF